MEKNITRKEIKPLIKETLSEMIKENREEIMSIIVEAIEEAVIANAIKEGRKNRFVSEKRIMKILER